MKDLNKHIKGDKAKWIITAVAILLIFVILGGVIALITTETNPKDWFTKEQNQEVATKNGDIALSDFEGNGITLSCASVAAEDNTVVKQLTAVVECTNDSVDTSVDWSIEWVTPVSEGAVVTDYVNVSSTADGSRIAYVTAYKPFHGGVILITATTRVGGFKATCRVTYVGIPDYMYFEKDGKTFTSLKMNYITLNPTVGDYYSFPIEFFSKLGQVGSPYQTPSFEIYQKNLGGRVVMTKQNINNGAVVETLGDSMISLGDNKYSEPHLFEQMCDARFDGNVLKIKIKKAFSSMELPTGVRTGTRYIYKEPYVDPRSGGVADIPTIDIYFREKTTGFEFALYIKVETTVTGVSLSSAELSF